MARTVRRARRVARVFALAARLSRLGADPRSKVKIFYATVLLGARRLLRRPGRHWHTLRLRVAGTRPQVAVSDYGELEVMCDILLDGEYALPEAAAPDVILDVGANIGVASLFFRAHYPKAEIVAIEPDPDTFAKLERNVGGDPGTRVLNAAVAAERGDVLLFRPPGHSIAASLKYRGRDRDASTRVPAETLDALCAELDLARIDVVKLDVEGAELEVLRGFSRLDEVAVIVGEAHPRLLGEDLDEFFTSLRAFEVCLLSETAEAISFLATRAGSPSADPAPRRG